MNEYPKRVLSLGAGVQSTALLLMMIHGEVPKADAVIFSDTGWEPKRFTPSSKTRIVDGRKQNAVS
jgi:hypothetical protein